MFVIWNEEGNDNLDDNADDAATAAAKAQAEKDAEAAKGTKPSDAEAKLLKEVMEKKEALAKAKLEAKASADAAKDLADKLKAFDGVNLDEVKTLLAERKEREDAKLAEKGEWDRLKQSMAEQHAKDIEKLKAELGAPVAELSDKLSKREREIHELTIGRSFSESNFIREDLTLTASKARIIYGSHFELKDGKVTAYDKPVGTEDRTPLVDANGEPLKFDAALAKLVELDPDRDNLLKSKIRAGSGSENDADAKNKEKDKHKSGISRIQAALAQGALPKFNK